MRPVEHAPPRPRHNGRVGRCVLAAVSVLAGVCAYGAHLGDAYQGLLILCATLTGVAFHLTHLFAGYARRAARDGRDDTRAVLDRAMARTTGTITTGAVGLVLLAALPVVTLISAPVGAAWVALVVAALTRLVLLTLASVILLHALPATLTST